MSLQLMSVDEQYKKFPTLNKEEVLKLQEWIKLQPHLPNINELEAIIFLYSCYNSVEAAKICVDTYFTVRTHCPEFFAQRNVNGPDVKSQMNTVLYTPLPGITPVNGYKVVYGRLLECDPSKFVFSDALKLFSMSIDLMLLEEGTAEGLVIVVDMNGVVFGHLARLGILTMKKFLYYLQEALPVRLVGVHFINIVSFMDKLLAIMRPFMKKELMDVLELHSKMDTFYKFVPQEMLPGELGGKAGTFKELQTSTYDNVKKYPQYFVEEETHRVNEKLRPGKPKNAGDLFGIEGNFKKLDFD